jgi:iron(III) transport system permease protein
MTAIPATGRKPPRFAGRAQRISGARALATAFMVALAALVLAPLASLIAIAVGGEADVWQHLAAYVLPIALAETALLLAGVAAITATVGAGTAWLVTSCRFPGRDALAWLLPLPLAVPTYIVAYVYADLLDAAGPVQTALRAAFGWRSPHEY